MRPVNFKESNFILHKPSSMTDKECGKPTFRERLSILFFGKIWLSVFTGKTQPPVWLMGKKTIF